MTVVDRAHSHPENAPHETPKDVTIVVNNAGVTLPKGKYMGLQIKKSAIEQGAKDIALDFVLSVQRGNHYKVVGDQEEIEIHQGLDFVAVTGDDNS